MSSPYRGAPGSPPCVLICAGLDPSGGAGLLADARVVSSLGARPVGVVTASTVQNTAGMIGGSPCDPGLVGEQLAFLLSDVEVGAVKVGMIGSSDLARAIAEAMSLTRAPLVWDPVMYPSRGDLPMASAAFADALAALRDHLTLLTPNAAELAYFARTPPLTSLADAIAAGRALAERLDCAVLVKGGHLGGAESPESHESIESVDVLIDRGGVDEAHELRAPRVRDGHHVHGTGCMLSTAIATHLALGADLLAACRAGKQLVSERIASPVSAGRGAPSVL